MIKRSKRKYDLEGKKEGPEVSRKTSIREVNEMLLRRRSPHKAKRKRHDRDRDRTSRL